MGIKNEEAVKQKTEDAVGAVMIFIFMYFAWALAYVLEPM